ncbi:MAG: DinB family protein [Chitinophagales bacterium]
MENSKQLANRFREVLLSGKWIANTNYKLQLSNVTWKQATHKIGTLNTIAALAYHINYYTAGIVNVFEGGALEIRDKFSFDLPPIKSQEDWNTLLKDMWSNAEQFANHVERMSDEKLESAFTDEKYGTYRRNIEGVIEHSYYHLGQISLIRKMLEEV